MRVWKWLKAYREAWHELCKRSSKEFLTKTERSYENDPRFRRYVDRYCQTRKVQLKEALRHRLVDEVRKYYENEEESKELEQERELVRMLEEKEKESVIQLCTVEKGVGMQKEIINMVLEERKRQDAKWGEQNHSAYVWSSIIGEEYGEMCKAINEFGFNPTPETEQDIYTEAIQTMASCMAMLECMERCRAK